MLMFSISLELQFHALRSFFFFFFKPQKIVSIKLTCLCISFFSLIYHYLLKTSVNSYSVDFKNHS